MSFCTEFKSLLELCSTSTYKNESSPAWDIKEKSSSFTDAQKLISVYTGSETIISVVADFTSANKFVIAFSEKRINNLF